MQRYSLSPGGEGRLKIPPEAGVRGNKVECKKLFTLGLITEFVVEERSSGIINAEGNP